MRPTEPPSPCTSICRLDDTGLCEGCLRTIDEIADWGSLNGERKREIMAHVADRRERRFSNDSPANRTDGANSDGAYSGGTNSGGTNS